MGAQGADALEVLRDLWRSQAQTDLDLGDDCETKACKKMSDAGVGFDDFAGAGEAERSAAWRGPAGARGQARPGREPARSHPAAGHRRTPAETHPVEYPGTVPELTQRLRGGGYLADRGLATTLLMSLSLRRPVLLEGEVGVGKTEVAKVLADVFGRRLIRLQCYEGISTSQALYEWDYARQMLQIRALSHDRGDRRAVG